MHFSSVSPEVKILVAKRSNEWFEASPVVLNAIPNPPGGTDSHMFGVLCVVRHISAAGRSLFQR
jgi:hypothetical protein